MAAIALVLLGGLAAAGFVLWGDWSARGSRRRSVVVLLALVGGLAGSAALGYTDLVPQTGWAAVAAFGLSLLAAVTCGGTVATSVLHLAETSRSGPVTGLTDPLVLRGGTWVGILERVAVVLALLVGSPEGAAVALAVKSLGRYPDLQTSSAAERFIIGTFASVLWAAGCAGAGWVLLH